MGAVPNKLLVFPAALPDDRINAPKMLGGLPKLLGEERLRFLKNPSPLGVGAENVKPVVVTVAGVAIPLELAVDGVAVVTCTVCQNTKALDLTQLPANIHGL